MDADDTIDYLKAAAASDKRKARSDFIRNKEDKIVASAQENITLALEKLDVELSYNRFGDVPLINSDPLDDAAVIRLWLTIDMEFGFRPEKRFFFDVVKDMARRNAFHPILDYLAALKWDRAARLDTWLIDHAKAPDTPYVRAVSRLPLIAAVRRVRHPGCKFDEMLVLESPQGKNKSSALKELAGGDEFFTDGMPLGLDGKHTIELLRGKWIVEIPELNGLNRRDVEAVKSFLSRTHDRGRTVWDILTSEVPRQNVCFGSINPSAGGYLKDPTGNRRFWPVPIKNIDLAAIKANRDQLWAEAAAREAGGESIRLDQSLWGAAAVEQEERTVEEPWITILAAAFGDLEGKIKSADLWTLLDTEPTPDKATRLAIAMHAIGFMGDKLRFGGKNPERCYWRTDRIERINVTTDGFGRNPMAHHGLRAVPEGAEKDKGRPM